MAPFGCFFFIFRSVATLVLAIVIFFSFLAYLSVDTVRDKFLTSEFYTESFAENSIYNRFYDEVLLDEEFEDTKSELLGDIEIVSDDEIIDLTKQIIEPSYLQSQVEAAVVGTIDYLNKDTDTPEVYIDLGPPLDLAKPVLLDYIDTKIDELEDVPVSTIDELRDELEILYADLEVGRIPTSIPKIEDPDILVATSVEEALSNLTPVEVNNPQEFEAELEEIYNDLTSAHLPSTIPSIENVPIAQREQFILAYDDVVAELAANPAIPADVREQVIAGLQENEAEIKDQIREGDIEAALNVATEPLTGPVVEEFVTTAYDEAVQALEDQGGLSEDALDGLREREDEIKAALVAGDIKGSLKLGARGLASPLIDEALDRVREELVASGDQGERRLLDLIGKAADQNDQTRAEFLEQREVDFTRDTLEQADLGAWALLLFIVLACLAMSAVHIPHLASSLRWPGTILLATGLIFLIIGIVLGSILPGQVDNLVEASTDGVDNPIPTSLVNIISDVLASMASDVASAWIQPSIIIMVVGLVLLLGSFFIRKLHIPFISR